MFITTLSKIQKKKKHTKNKRFVKKHGTSVK